MDEHLKNPDVFKFGIFKSQAPVEQLGEETVFILDPKGDLILTVRNKDDDQSALFRVSSEVLKQSSGYFRGLLAPHSHTGAALAPSLQRFTPKPSGKQRATDDVPITALPRLDTVLEVTLTYKVNFRPVVTGFLLLLHLEHKKEPNVHQQYYLLEELTDFVAIADWFGALDTIRTSIRGNIDPKRRWKKEPCELGEDVLRQRIFVASSLCLHRELQLYSAALIDRGLRITPQDADTHGEMPVWWNLPSGIEDEVRYRHECVVSKIEEVVAFVYGQYLNAVCGGPSQCKRDPSSALKCDEFHFERLSKFLRMDRGLPELLPDGEKLVIDRRRWPLALSLRALIGRLSGIPVAWLDKDHKRCGPSYDMVEGLYLIYCMLDSDLIGIGIEGCDLAIPGHPVRQMQDTTRLAGEGPLPRLWLEIDVDSLAESAGSDDGDESGSGTDGDTEMADDDDDNTETSRSEDTEMGQPGRLRARRWPSPWPWPHWKPWLAREFLTSRKVKWKELIELKPDYIPNGRIKRGVLKLEDALKSEDTIYC